MRPLKCSSGCTCRRQISPIIYSNLSNVPDHFQFYFQVRVRFRGLYFYENKHGCKLKHKHSHHKWRKKTFYTLNVVVISHLFCLDARHLLDQGWVWTSHMPSSWNSLYYLRDLQLLPWCNQTRGQHSMKVFFPLQFNRNNPPLFSKSNKERQGFLAAAVSKFGDCDSSHKVKGTGKIRAWGRITSVSRLVHEATFCLELYLGTCLPSSVYRTENAYRR